MPPISFFFPLLFSYIYLRLFIFPFLWEEPQKGSELSLLNGISLSFSSFKARAFRSGVPFSDIIFWFLLSYSSLNKKVIFSSLFDCGRSKVNIHICQRQANNRKELSGLLLDNVLGWVFPWETKNQFHELAVEVQC